MIQSCVGDCRGQHGCSLESKDGTLYQKAVKGSHPFNSFPGQRVGWWTPKAVLFTPSTRLGFCHFIGITFEMCFPHQSPD
jgi:hypothetical protein